MNEIFNFEDDAGSSDNSLIVEQTELTEDCVSKKYDFRTARRIQLAKQMLTNQSLLALKSLENEEAIAITRARYLAMLNPHWSTEKEAELFSVNSDQSFIDFGKSSLTLITPSSSMVEAIEDSRPSSYSSSYSPNSFKSPSKLRFTDQ